MTDHVTPEEHSSVVGGSTASRRINCPRSYTLEQRVPPDPGNAYAREGTALHELIAIVLRDDVEPDTLLPFTFKGEDNGEPWEYTVDADLWADLGEPALRAFDRFVEDIEKDFEDDFVFLIEKRCAMPGIEGAFGTSDIIWRCGTASGVWDWKFGRTPVKAEANKQLMFYARAAMATHPELFGIGPQGEIADPDRLVILSIMQPQVSDQPDEWETSIAALDTFRLNLIAAVKEAKANGDKARVAKGAWCDFAMCKAICPLWAGRSATFGEKMAALNAALGEAGENAELTDVDGFEDMLPELLDLAETAEAWSRTVFAMAHQLAEDGRPPEGWRLKAKRSSGRDWTVDDEAIKKYMTGRRYKIDEFAPRQMLSVAQAEKLLKRDGRVLDEDMYEAKPSSGTTLVRSDDPSPEVAAAPERHKALGAKLAALGGAMEQETEQ